MSILAFLFLLFAICLVLGMPIGFAIGLASAMSILWKTSLPITIVAQRMFAGCDSFPLLAVPLFILGGLLMDKGGISAQLVILAKSLVGHVRGGLGMTSSLAATLFGTISGSANATTAAIGTILIPSMKKEGYGGGLAAAITATAGCLGVIIPPSVCMVVAAVSGGLSVGVLFLAGVVPGILTCAGFMVVSHIIAIRRNFPTEKRANLKEVLYAFKNALIALGMPIIILGGIFGGIFTATEASAVAAVYALIVGLFVTRKLKVSHLFKIFLNAAVLTALPMLVVATTSLLGWIMTREQMPQSLSIMMLKISSNPLVFLMLINVFLLIMGTFMDVVPGILITIPIFLPIAVQLGIHPIHFAVILVFALVIGAATPPVGVTMFVACSIADVKITEIVKSVGPYLLVMIAVLLLITLIPILIVGLPNLIMPQFM